MDKIETTLPDYEGDKNCLHCRLAKALDSYFNDIGDLTGGEILQHFAILLGDILTGLDRKMLEEELTEFMNNIMQRIRENNQRGDNNVTVSSETTH